MTYFNKIAAASALALILTSGSAIAGDYKEKTKSNVMTDATQGMSLKMKERKQLKKMVKSNMTADEKASWATLSKSEQTEWMNTAIEAQKRKMIADNALDGKTNKIISAREVTKSNMISSEANMRPNEKMLNVNDTVGEYIQSGGEARIQANNKILMSDGRKVTKTKVMMSETDNAIRNNVIAVPTTDADIVTSVSCPIGTTAQADMTCLITGDYEANS